MEAKQKEIRHIDFCTAVVRPLIYKNCYLWTYGIVDENDNVWYESMHRIMVRPLSDVVELHKCITRQKPVKIKKAEFGNWVTKYAFENDIPSGTYVSDEVRAAAFHSPESKKPLKLI